jgi:L-rhamnose-H+ transport protein
MLTGIFACSWAGKLKEHALSHEAQDRKALRRSYGLGLTLCILSGVLSSCGNLGFAFGSAISATALRHGATEELASNLLWAVITVPLFLCNALYCLYLLRRRRTFSKFLLAGIGFHYLLAALMGALWLGGMVLYGMGAHRLGGIGPSIGWSMMVSCIVIVANVWGVLTGEWKGGGEKCVRIMIVGLVMLVAAIFTIGYSAVF